MIRDLADFCQAAEKSVEEYRENKNKPDRCPLAEWEVWWYMREFFGVYGEYHTFWKYVKASGLRWFIPLKVKEKKVEKSVEISGQ